MLRLFLSIFLFYQCLSVFCQEQETAKRMSVFASAHLSHLGYYAVVGGEYRFKEFSFQLAPVLNVYSAHLPLDGPLGFDVAINYSPLHSADKAIDATVGMDYKMVFDKKNRSQEFSFGYGMSIRLVGKLCFVNGIQAGIYREAIYSLRDGKTTSTYGFNPLIKLGFKYRL